MNSKSKNLMKKEKAGGGVFGRLRFLQPTTNNLQPNSGQLLIEMLVALGILTVGFLGVMTLLSRALGLNRVVADNYAATYLAIEGIEVTKNILDSNIIAGSGWATNGGFQDGDFEVQYDSRELISPATGAPLSFDPDSRLYGYELPGGNPVATPFVRTVHITLKTNEVVVNSKVDWTSRGGGTFNVNLEDHFYNWR